MKIQYLFSLTLIVLFGCNQNNVKTDPSVAAVFTAHHVKGSFALLENGTGDFVIQDLNFYKDSAKAPLQTFFIIPQLMAFNNGLMTHTASNTIDSLGVNISLMNQMGSPAIKKTLDSLHYGKKVDSLSLENGWKDGSVRISLDEQLGLIKRLYFGKLPFEKKTQEWMKKQLQRESNSNYTLSFLNGFDENRSYLLGYIEENKHPYFFVLYMTAEAGNAGFNNNVVILKALLEKQGFFKGLR